MINNINTKLLGLVFVLAYPATCLGWSTTEIHLLYGDGFQQKGNPNDIKKTTTTLLHASGAGLFKQFFFVDVYDKRGELGQGGREEPDASGFYGEYYGDFSVSKVAWLAVR